MGIFGKLFKETPKNVPVLDKEFGDTGTTMYNGMISGEEYNPDLSGTTKYRVFDKMRKGDATVAASLKVIKLPLRSANWYVKPANEDKSAIEQAKFIEYNLKELMENTWDDFLREALLMLDYGVFVFEKVFANVEYEGKTYFGWKKFASRHPRTISAWKMKDGTSSGVTQITSEKGTIDIPIEKLLIFTNEKEGDNWEGISILRAAYKSWFFKDTFEQIDAMAFERQGLGVPFCKLPKGYTPSDKKAAISIVKNLRANEKAYIVYPEDYEVGFMDMGAGKVRDPKSSIEYHNRQIVLNVLAQFLMLGSGGSTGSYALSEDQSDFFYDSLQAVAKNIKDVVNKYAIKQLVDLNWPGTKVYPTLEVDEIGKIDRVAFATAINTLVGASVLDTDDDELKKYIRKEMDLPEAPILTDAEKKAKQELKTKAEADANVKAKKDIEINQKKATEKAQKKNLHLLNESFKPFRELTFAEQKVNFGNLKTELDTQEKIFSEILVKSFNNEQEDILKQFKTAIEKEDYLSIQDISLSGKGKYTDEMFGKMKELYNFGKNTVAAEINVATPKTPQEDLDRLMAQATIISDDHENRALIKAKIAAINSIAKNTDIEKAMVNVERILNESLDGLGKKTAAIIAADTVNQGRRFTQKQNLPDIYAFQRSELLDEKTCNFCLSMDARTVAPNDDWVDEGEFHSHCRGIWVEIMKDEAELPTVSGVPEMIAKNYAGVNDFKQLKAPKVKKDSAAADTIKEDYEREIAEREAKIAEYESSGTYPDRIKSHKKKITSMKKILKKLK